MENKRVKGNFRGLVPFIVFILVYLGTGMYLHLKGVKLAFYQLPGPVAAAAGVCAAFVFFKSELEEKFTDFLAGCGHRDIMTTTNGRG